MEGFSDPQPCDENVTNLVLKLRPRFESNANRTFTTYEPQNFSSRQDDENRTSYFVELNLGDGITGKLGFTYNSESHTAEIFTTSVEGNLGNMDLV